VKKRYYENLSHLSKEAWPENPLLPDFIAVVERMSVVVNSR
jgi:hypothetical protein